MNALHALLLLGCLHHCQIAQEYADYTQRVTQEQRFLDDFQRHLREAAVVARDDPLPRPLAGIQNP